MARVEGIDPQQASFLMRQVFKKVRKMLGRNLTPQTSPRPIASRWRRCWRIYRTAKAIAIACGWIAF